MSRRAELWIVGVAFGVSIGLLIAGYYDARSCSLRRSHEIVFVFGPAALGLIAGAGLPRRPSWKAVAALACGFVAFVAALVVLLSGNGAGGCGF